MPSKQHIEGAGAHARRRGATGTSATWVVLLRGLATLVLVLAGIVTSTLIGSDALAQDPSTVVKSGSKSSFPKQPGTLAVPKVDKGSPLYLQADELIYDTKGSRVIARGNVEVYYGGNVLTGDQVVYDQAANTLTAEGNAMLKEPGGNVVRGERIVTTSDFRDAFIQKLSVEAKDNTRIAGESAIRRDGNVTEFSKGKFTACKNDAGMPPLWCISASRIVHDQRAASVAYQDAQFELFGVPVLYLPYFEHADPSVKRRSGFLAPQFGYSSTLGYQVDTPYYFALAPNYDFMFTPRYFSTHGLMYQGEWRHRIQWGQVKGTYSIKAAGIEQDGSTLSDLTPERRALLDGWRGTIETKGNFSLSSWWKFGWDVTIESDDTFRRFYRFDSLLQTDRVNLAYLQGLSERNYFAMTFYQFGGLLIEDKSLAESRVLPVIDYNYVFAQPVAGGEMSFSGNAMSLSRSDGSDTTRAIMEARWRRQLIDPIGQVFTPYLAVRGDVYQVSNGTNPDTMLPSGDESIFRGVATAALTYAYPFVAQDSSGGTHTIAPMAQIIARPAHVDQRRLPNEDARSVNFDDSILFDYDKFSGWDRIETGVRANYGFGYTWQGRSGAFARLVVGQSHHLGGDNAFLDPGLDKSGAPLFTINSGLETRRSDYVVGAYLSPFTAFRFVSQGRFDEETLSLRRMDTTAIVNLGPLQAVAAHSYVRNDDTLTSLGVLGAQQDIVASAMLRITDHWSVGVLGRYDIDAHKMLQDGIIVKYADECFVLTATYNESHIFDPTRDVRPDRSIMLRFEFKHLGEFGFKQDHVFADNQPPKF